MISRQWIWKKWISLYAKVVKEKATPEYIARGWAIGMFFGCLIPFGLQLICSIPTAFLLKGSKIGAIFGTLLTNHFTIFIIYPIQCYVGDKLTGGNISYAVVEEAFKDVVNEQSYEALLGIGWELVVSFFVGGAILTAVMTPITYWFVKNLVIRYRAKKSMKTEKKVQS